MAQECTVCRHGERIAIDEAILARNSYRDIAGRYGTSKSAVARHREHLPQKLVEAHSAAEVSKAGDLLDHVLALHRRAESLLEEAERNGLLETAIRAIREARGCLELLAKLNGALRQSQVNIVTVELDAATAARMAETYLARRQGLLETTYEHD